MSENVFEPPTSRSPAAGPAGGPPLHGPGLIAACTFLFSPVVGGAIAAVNHWRCGDSRRALGVVVLGIGLLGLATVLGAVLPDSVARAAGIGLSVGAAMVLYQDALQLRSRFPTAPSASPLWPIAGGVGFMVLLVALPVVAWIVTGDPALRPFAPGMPP